MKSSIVQDCGGSAGGGGAPSSERRIFELNTVFEKRDPERKFMSNEVCTGKYTCLTFLPKNLFFQFTKLANFYFLFLVLL